LGGSAGNADARKNAARSADLGIVNTASASLGWPGFGSVEVRRVLVYVRAAIGFDIASKSQRHRFQ